MSNELPAGSRMARFAKEYRRARTLIVGCLLATGATSPPPGALPASPAIRSSAECPSALPTVARGRGRNGLVIETPPFRLVNLAFYDRYEQKVLYAITSAGQRFWPGQYDLAPRSGVRTQWQPMGDFTSDDVAKVIASDCYRATVVLNGIPLGRFDETTNDASRIHIGDSTYFAPCPQRKRCLYVTVSQAAWAAAKPPHVLEIRVTEVRTAQASPTNVPAIDENGDVIPAGQYNYRALPASRANIQANPRTKGSYFVAKVWPTFQHARCQNCHALGSVAALISAHSNIFMFKQNYAALVVKKSSPTGAVISCSAGCHDIAGNTIVIGQVFEETEWKAPAFERNINWSQMNAALGCSRVTANLATEAKASHHFYEDARIAWAVNRAITPAGTSLERAPPGSFEMFRAVLEPWLRGAMPCP